MAMLVFKIHRLIPVAVLKSKQEVNYISRQV